jgi:hypothetical protein
MIAAAAGVAAVVVACGSSDMPAAGTGETTAMHIEVLRYFLTSLREGTGPVFIVERVDAAAADPMQHSAGTDVIPAAERDAITTALQDIAGVRFVATTEETLTDQDSCPLVSDGGTVITIGPVTPAKGSYHVAMSAFRSCLSARWLTYSVVRSGDAWKVTGTVGGESIAERSTASNSPPGRDEGVGEATPSDTGASAGLRVRVLAVKATAHRIRRAVPEGLQR